MNTVIKMMWLMTHINIGATLALISLTWFGAACGTSAHINIGATLALISWLFWPHHGSASNNDPSTLAVPAHIRAAISSPKESP